MRAVLAQLRAEEAALRLPRRGRRAAAPTAWAGCWARARSASACRPARDALPARDRAHASTTRCSSPTPRASRSRRCAREAREHGFATVCVNPAWVRLCADAAARLARPRVCTVVGFPLGATLPEVKAFEAARVVADGRLRGGHGHERRARSSPATTGWSSATSPAVVEASRPGGALVKVIIEAALLTDDEKVKACVLAKAAGADFVKTSTGFGPGGATAADVALMRRVVGPEMGVKAAGGVRDLQVRAGHARGGRRPHRRQRRASRSSRRARAWPPRRRPRAARGTRPL